MGEQSSTLDHGQRGIGKGPHHLLRPVDGEEHIPLAPHQQNVAVEHLRIETWFPYDEQTTAVCKSLAATGS